MLYKIDIPANRYDMLCVEGIARALNVFSHGKEPATYRTVSPAGEGGACGRAAAARSMRRLRAQA